MVDMDDVIPVIFSLKENLPFIALEKYVFTTDKYILRFDVRI